jgi:hypothetical protein
MQFFFPGLSNALRGASINHFTCKYYVEAMKHGSKYIYQTMPRLLTIWADMAQIDYIVAGERDKHFVLLVILYKCKSAGVLI